MKHKLRASTENLLRLAASERVRQLEKQDHNLNVVVKQLELLETVNEIILMANNSPKGLVEIVFTEKSNPEFSNEEVIRNSVESISSFNTADMDTRLYRTVIIVDPLWSNDLKVLQAPYGSDNSYLS